MRPKYEGEIITTYGTDVTDMTHEQVKALEDPNSPEFEAAFERLLEDSRKGIREMPDYAAASAAIKKVA